MCTGHTLECHNEDGWRGRRGEKKFAMLFKSKKTMAIVDAKFETSEFAVKQRAFVPKVKREVEREKK